MAISPNMLNSQFLEEVDHYEDLIDKILIRKTLSPGSSISIDVPTSMTHPHFKIIRERYISAGWGNVIWHSDQRDGDYLSFIMINKTREN
jgi:hypothetical protein